MLSFDLLPNASEFQIVAPIQKKKKNHVSHEDFTSFHACTLEIFQTCFFTHFCSVKFSLSGEREGWAGAGMSPRSQDMVLKERCKNTV